MATGTTQPDWPAAAIDSLDTPTGTLCPAVPYSENPVVVQYDTAADTDCDGLVNGIEWAWGSNPTLADTDADGSPDFQEMFQFTDPTNPDTDGDGFLDRPASVYGDNTDTAMDNCPTVANPSQLNSDGHRRDNGPNISEHVRKQPQPGQAGRRLRPGQRQRRRHRRVRDLHRRRQGNHQPAPARHRR